MKLRLLSPVTAVALLATLPVVGQSTFTRITTGPIATEGGYSNRGCWVDYDGDGDLDLFVANGGWDFGLPAAANFLYRNDGFGGFTKITSGPAVEDVEQSMCGAWGDCDNDGHLDLFVANLGGGDFSNASAWRNSFYRNLGEGTFARITDTPLDKDGGAHMAGIWADYDNDGHLDLLVANWNGPRLLYHNNRDATFTRITAGLLVTDVTAAQGAVWADYDGDGDLDVFITNFDGPPPTAQRNSLYRNEGNGVFTRIATGHPVTEEALHVSSVWGDYDNDGDLDLYVCVLMTKRNCLYRNNGDGTFLKITEGAPVSISGSASAAWADYDNDGFLDLFVARGQNGNRLFHNNGDGTLTQITTEGIGTDMGYSVGCDWGDYDNDGSLDLFVANGTYAAGQSQANNFLYHNDGNANRWLKVKLEGTVSNRAAIGAKVRVLASLGGRAMWQLREVSVGCGYSGHNLLPHFGLRDAERADVVRIEWPSGIVQELRDVAANQTLSVTEPPRLDAPGVGRIRIHCWEGQKFEAEVSNDLATWTSLGVITNETGTLEVTDGDSANHPYRFYRTKSQ